MAHVVPQTILSQLGGNRFIMMTGAKNFVGSEDALIFDLPKGHKMRITLTAMDDYDIEYFKWNRKAFDLDTIKKVTGVYCDNLQDIFTSITGLYTKL